MLLKRANICIPIALSAIASFSCAAPSRVIADVAITYSVNVSGLPQMPARPGVTPPKFPVIVKAFYSGDKARVEQVGGAVTIYDLAAQSTIRLDPKTKTYYIQPAFNRGGRGGGGGGFGGGGGGGFGGGGGGGFGGGGGNRGGGSTATLTKTSESKPILSVTGTRYTLVGSIAFGGGGRRRGGYGGGDTGGTNPQPPAGGVTMPTTAVTGDVWFSPSIAIPATATSADPEVSVLSLGQRTLTRPLSTAVFGVRQIPLSGKISMTMTIPDFSGNGGAPTTRTIVESFTATSISKTPVSPTLFAAPAAYTKVDPPQRGGRGGGGGGGGFGGRGGRGGGGGGFGGGFGGGGGYGGGGGNGGGGYGGGGGDNGGGDNGGGAPPMDNGGGDNGGGGNGTPPPDNGGGDNNGN